MVLRVEAIGSATSALQGALQQLASSAHNIANARTAKATDEDAFTGEQVVRTDGKAGLEISVVPEGTDEGVVVHEPEHPVADAAGNVRYPDIDLGSQLIDLTVAQQEVELQVSTINRAVDTYRDMLAMTTSDRERLAAAPTRTFSA